MIGIFDQVFDVSRPSAAIVNGKPVSGLISIGGVRGRLTVLSRGQLFNVGPDQQRLSHRFSVDSSVDIMAGDVVSGNGQRVRVDAVGLTSTGRRKECLCEAIGND